MKNLSLKEEIYIYSMEGAEWEFNPRCWKSARSWVWAIDYTAPKYYWAVLNNKNIKT